jgi:hypothetical protein
MSPFPLEKLLTDLVSYFSRGVPVGNVQRQKLIIAFQKLFDMSCSLTEEKYNEEDYPSTNKGL